MDLFDIIDIEDAKTHPEDCQHHHEDKTLTVWPGETHERLTWTCRACGHIRGRAK